MQEKTQERPFAVSNVQQLHGRKLPETVVNVLLLPLEEDPPRRAMLLAVHEVDPAPHRPKLPVRLAFEIHVPALVTALQLPHVLRPLVPGEGGRHGQYTTLPPAFLPVRFPSP